MTTELLAAALAAAEAGAVVLRRYFRTADLEVRKKAENDFVTRADDLIGRSFQVAPCPAAAAKRLPPSGSSTTPASSSPERRRQAIETQ